MYTLCGMYNVNRSYAIIMKHIILIMSLVIVLLFIYIIENEKDCASVQPFFIKKGVKTAP